MKKVFIALFLTISVMAGAQSNTDTIKAFLDGIINFEGVEVNDHNPIITVNELAAQQAEKTLSLTKENVSETFEQAKEYMQVLIIVENHTAVLVTDWEDCIQSGSWGTCMPYGEGYVKRAQLTKLTDHINNIIGLPGDKERKVYLFNE